MSEKELGVRKSDKTNKQPIKKLENFKYNSDLFRTKMSIPILIIMQYS